MTRRCGPWKWCVPFLPLLTLTSCLVVVSTTPTALSGATIVFVATDHRGAFVSALHVTVNDVGGSWQSAGLTGGDGSFLCDVRPGVTRVRVEAVAPAGYVLGSGQVPRHLDVPGGGSVRVEIRLTTR